jgi:phage terminase large subunit GpA-like protein
MIGSPKSRDSGNTLDLKEYPGGVLILATAGSAIQLASMPIRYLFFDEADFQQKAMVSEEGDALDLAEQRTQTFGRRRKVFIPSTPHRRGLSLSGGMWRAPACYYVQCCTA